MGAPASGHHPAANGPLASWSPAGWRARHAAQQPAWPDLDQLRAVTSELGRLPCLVQPAEIRSLGAQLATACRGGGFVIQGGDCAESFDDVTTPYVTARARLITALGQSFHRRTGVVPVLVSRMAGQYAKPRSRDTELVDGHQLPVFRGHMVNSPQPLPQARRPDARRVLHAYYQSAATLNLLRSLRRHDDSIAEGHGLSDHTMSDCAGLPEPGGATVTPLMPLWVSHEAVILPYEQALVRQHPISQTWFLTSTHFPWVGDRTRAPSGAHIEFMRGIVNPVAVKIGPSATPHEVAAICDLLNPGRLPGRLTLVTRLGAERVDEVLPGLVAAVRDHGHLVLWMCDPMHGNTRRTFSGLKTRRLEDVFAELDRWFDQLRMADQHPGGVHLEFTPDDVTECVEDAQSHEPAPGLRYRTLCDPRLDARQATRVIEHVAMRFQQPSGWPDTVTGRRYPDGRRAS